MSWNGGRSRGLAASLPVGRNVVRDETGDPSEPREEAWRDPVSGVVERVRIEPDRSVIEGPLTAAEEERVQQPDQSAGTNVSPPRRSAVRDCSQLLWGGSRSQLRLRQKQGRGLSAPPLTILPAPKL